MMSRPALKILKPLIILAILAALGASFWYSEAWLKLCYGLALFLFGMQCIEEGLHSAAGGTLEKLMAKSTATPAKGLLFGIGATFILQSSTLVSLLTIAFLSTGMITLAGGLAIIFGTNLGATSGIWLLALAGQSISLSPAAVPMLVFGILAGFFNNKAKAIGRVLVGISLIFLGIDAIKNGFQAIGGQIDFTTIQVSGVAEILIFCGIGLVLTLVLQSSHATLILTLAALAGGQINMEQGFAIAMGSNVGTSASTAVVGMLGSERSGQRLALAHLIFNSVTALLSLLLWLPLTKLVAVVANATGMSNLLQLALFHTLFNVFGLAVFWRLQGRLADKLQQWLPEPAQRSGLLPESSEAVRPRFLNDNMLRAGDTALRAVSQEIRHLSDLSLEVVCHALYVPASSLDDYCGSGVLPAPQMPLETNVQSFYEWQIKPLYSDILDFTSKIDIDDNESRRHKLTTAHLAAFQMVENVKESKHLQKNLQRFLQTPNDAAYADYLALRQHLVATLCRFHHAGALHAHTPAWQEHLDGMSRHAESLESLRDQVLDKLRHNQIDGLQASSLMNDINYARRINAGLLEVLHSAADIFAAPESQSA
ncbi:Na/Pi symporter [Conchiformibius steedae]